MIWKQVIATSPRYWVPKSVSTVQSSQQHASGCSWLANYAY